jgi:hypothetical protein
MKTSGRNAARKAQLKKETVRLLEVRALTADELAQAAGGYVPPKPSCLCGTFN